MGDVKNCHVFTEIPELSDKKIEEFFEGELCMFAINETNVYSWGWNDHGQLGRSFKCDEILKPKKIKFFTDKNIINIS